MNKGYYINSLEPDKPTRLCRKWRIRYPTGAKYANGQPKCKAETFEGTRSAAERHAQENVIGNKKPSSYTVFQWCEERNEAEYIASLVSLNTYRKRRTFIRNINLHIGAIKLNELTPEHILLMLSELSKGKTISGKPLSGSSLACLRSTLRYFMQCATRERVIPFNPVSLVKPPKNDTPERKILSDDQWKFLRMHLDVRDRHELAVLILLMTGMREGEVCGLKFSDITDDEYFYIHASMQDNGHIKDTKTESSTRYVKIPKYLRIRMIKAPRNGDYICADKQGRPLRPNTLAAWWRRQRDSFGCAGYTLHEIGRHTTVSQMIAAGIDIKSACAVTGQSEITMLKVYAHAAQKQAAGTASDALSKLRDNLT